MEQTIKVKGMVCNRCILIIERAFSLAGIILIEISLGRITFLSSGSPKQLNEIASIIENLGFEILNDKNELLIEKTILIIDNYFKEDIYKEKGFKFSTYISDHLNVSYNTISDIFSRSKGSTIEKFIILKRLDKVKEHLVYTSSTLSEIADKMGFNSVFHLSRQFKDYTGKAPSDFRTENQNKRKDINSIS